MRLYSSGGSFPVFLTSAAAVGGPDLFIRPQGQIFGGGMNQICKIERKGLRWGEYCKKKIRKDKKLVCAYRNFVSVKKRSGHASGRIHGPPLSHGVDGGQACVPAICADDCFEALLRYDSCRKR